MAQIYLHLDNAWFAGEHRRALEAIDAHGRSWMRLVDVEVILEEACRHWLHDAMFPACRFPPWPLESMAQLLAGWESAQPIDLSELGRWVLDAGGPERASVGGEAVAIGLDVGSRRHVRRAVVARDVDGVLEAVRRQVLSDWGLTRSAEVELQQPIRAPAADSRAVPVRLVEVDTARAVRVSYLLEGARQSVGLAELIELMVEPPVSCRPKSSLPFQTSWAEPDVEAYLAALVDGQILRRSLGDAPASGEGAEVAWAAVSNWVQIPWLHPEPRIVGPDGRSWRVLGLNGLAVEAPLEGPESFTIELHSGGRATLFRPAPSGHKLADFRGQLLPTVLRENWGITVGARLQVVGYDRPVQVDAVTPTMVVFDGAQFDWSIAELLERLDPLPTDLQERFGTPPGNRDYPVRERDQVSVRGVPGVRFVVRSRTSDGGMWLTAPPGRDGRGWEVCLAKWEVRQRVRGRPSGPSSTQPARDR